MIKFFKNYWLLILIILIAAALRLYRLGVNPPSLHWDETAIGYNAYSILKTGRDEYGQFLPLIFKSFGDFKPGLYIYLTVPSMAAFGLSELAVRLPSALLGIFSVWLTFQLGWLMFKEKKLALFSALALALSPWHLHFSRGAWEANLALCLILLAVFCFFKAEKKKIKWLYFSALSFEAALFAYQSSKVFVPLVILGLWLAFWKKIKSLAKKHLLISLTVLLLIALPVYFSIFTGGGGRLKVMSLFSYPREEGEVQEILKQDQDNQIYFKIFHSEPLALFRSFLHRYFNHFSGKFLFFEGDWSSARHGVPYAGVLYYLDLVFLLAGAFWLIKKNTFSTKFIWFWLLVAPLPAALSRDSIQATRSLNMVWPLMVVLGVGMWQIFEWLRKQKKLAAVFWSLVLILGYLWCFFYYLDQYYLHYPRQSSQYWQYGYKQLISEIAPLKNNYSQIIMTPQYGQPYIYWLFYNRYEPAIYQQKAQLKESLVGDVGRVEKLDNIEFRPVFWPSDRNLKKTLLIGTELELPLSEIDLNQTTILTEVRFLNGNLAFRVVEIP
ncbi:phospholipid carrier-dependent glycosyltransferase [Candidatus Shapirobacteria bacterium]|nr:phospholipid carrier-dependent glycosyltransferase [Candidatus Shapirobacteria bacterium]